MSEPVVQNPHTSLGIVESHRIGDGKPLRYRKTEAETRRRIGFLGQDERPRSRRRAEGDQIAETVVHQIGHRGHHPSRCHLLAAFAGALERPARHEQGSEVAFRQLGVVGRSETRS